MNRVFTPIKFGSLEVKNRFVRSATASGGGDKYGDAGAEYPNSFEALASGGVGLIFTGHIFVSPEGRAGDGQVGLWRDSQVDLLRGVPEICHKYGAKVAAQISNAGPSSKPLYDSATIFRPNADPNEIKFVQETFVLAAKRAEAAGFDGVQLHCAHFYGLSQFISLQTNHRIDNYGGNAKNRFRICVEIISEIRRECPKFPIFIKINCNDGENDNEYFEDMVEILSECQSLGIAGVELSGDPPIQDNHPAQPFFFGRAAQLCKRSGKYKNLPLILVGGIRSMADINAALDAGISAVSFSRPFMKQPDFPNILAKDENFLL